MLYSVCHIVCVTETTTPSPGAPFNEDSVRKRFSSTDQAGAGEKARWVLSDIHTDRPAAWWMGKVTVPDDFISNYLIRPAAAQRYTITYLSIFSSSLNSIWWGMTIALISTYSTILFPPIFPEASPPGLPDWAGNLAQSGNTAPYPNTPPPWLYGGVHPPVNILSFKQRAFQLQWVARRR